MDNFELPTNVKQIGTIEGGLRIYVEDYVFTFVQQYTQAGGNGERLAMLVGRYMTIDASPVLFISGAIEGKYCIEERGGMEFTEKSYEYASDTMDRYFSSLEIVGWVQSQPGYGTYLSSKYYNYHMDNFTKEFQVLYVTDPIQRLNTFYVYNDAGELAESKGYFVYYDKNKAMHEYMIDNKTQSFNKTYKSQDHKDTKEEAADDPAEVPEESPRTLSLRGTSQRADATREPTLRGSGRSAAGGAAKTTAATQRGRIATTTRGRKPTAGTDQRRLINMLTGLCAVMFLVSFIMGAGLIRSDDRINVLEQNLAALNTAYRNLAASSEQTQSAFAPDNTPAGQSGLVVTEDGNKLLEEENARAMESTNPASPLETPSETAAGETPAVETSGTAGASIPETYTVQQGDNLIAISQKIYGNSDMVEKIMEANDITDPDKIFFGKILIMPKP